MSQAREWIAWKGMGWLRRQGMCLWAVLIVGVMTARLARADDYVFVVDVSYSMHEQFYDSNTRQNSTKIAIVQSALRDHFSSLPLGSRITVFWFNTVSSSQEFVLSGEAQRQELLRWVNNLRGKVSGGTHMWDTLRQGLLVASEYSRQNSNQTVCVCVLTDGLDNDPRYRGQSADSIIDHLQQEFPSLDGESIRANLVLLGSFDLDMHYHKGVKREDDHTWQVPLPPILNMEPNAAQAGKEVVFSDLSHRKYAYYNWSVDDVPVSQQEVFKTTFSKGGEYVVRLHIGTMDGQKEFASMKVPVAENLPPLRPDFTYQPSAPEPGDKVALIATADGRDITFAWSLDGQPMASTAAAEHVFPNGGNFVVQLEARDTAGRSEKITKKMVVTERPLAPAFSSPEEAASGQAVEFSDQTPGRATGWHWEFGDGETSAEKNPSHVFKNQDDTPASRTVTMQVTTRSGKTYNAPSRTISILPAARKPIAGFDAPTNAVQVGKLAVFRNKSVGGEKYLWDFGGEGTSDFRDDGEFEFKTPGPKKVRLTVSGPGGEDTAEQTVTVQPREVSVTLTWLGADGRNVSMPVTVDFGSGKITHVSTGELVTTNDNQFEIIVPAEIPPGGAVKISLDDAATNTFFLERRNGDNYQSLSQSTVLKKSERFRVNYSKEAKTGDHTGKLTIHTEGQNVLLNGAPQPISLGVHFSIVEDEPPPVIPMIIIALAVGGLLCYLFWPRFRYPVKIGLQESAGRTGANEGAPNSASVSYITLDREGQTISLAEDKNSTRVFDLNAPNWFIVGKKKGLELCNRVNAKQKTLKAGTTSQIEDKSGKQRSITVALIAQLKPKGR